MIALFTALPSGGGCESAVDRRDPSRLPSGIREVG